MEAELDELTLKNSYSLNELEPGIIPTGGSGGGISEEKDPTVPNHVKNITSTDIDNWNKKVNQLELAEVKSQVKSLQDNKAETDYVEEVESIAKGANQCKTYGDYQTMIEAFNNMPNNTYRTGQDIRNLTVNVPDLWIAYIEETSVPYTYTNDEAFVNELVENGFVQVGYYKFGMLETQKVNLADYVKNEQLDRKVNENLNKLISVTQLDDGSYSLTINTEV